MVLSLEDQERLIASSERSLKRLQSLLGAAVTPFAKPVEMLRRRFRASATSEPWNEGLNAVIAELEDLNHRTEQDFLKIGGKLTEFLRAVQQISSELTALTDLISGEQGSMASQALTAVLERTREMAARIEESTSVLGGMRATAASVRGTLSEFKGTVSTFRTLGVLTQIETARLGREGADFGNLPEEVKSLAESIRSGVESALETAKELIQPIESALQNVSVLEATQSKELSSVIAGVSVRLASFRERQVRAHEASIRLGAQYQGISDSIRELVIAIQFHDITRQQVEHVIDALKRVRTETQAEGRFRLGPPRGAATVLKLQSLQLADAGQKFGTSVDRIERNLDGIARRVGEMADESRSLLGLSEDEHDSFFVEMERGCTVILSAIGNSATSEQATRATAGHLEQAIDKMRESVLAIRSIDIHIQRMALNASIRAAHIGNSGEALSVLAGAMQRLGDESGQRSDSIIEALGSMHHAVAPWAQETDSLVASGQAGESSVHDRMRTTVAELHTSSERSFARTTQVASLGSRLCEEASELRSTFSAGKVFSEAVQQAQARLKQMEAEAVDSSQDSEAREPALDDFAQHYTMEAERDVHASISRAEPAPVAVMTTAEPPAVSEEVAVSAPDDDLGDNVELF
jgi:hypothetical protein